MRDINQLFYGTHPAEITDEEFEQVILPYFRKQRTEMLTATDAGKRAPTTKRVAKIKTAPPPNLSLDDLLSGT